MKFKNDRFLFSLFAICLCFLSSGCPFEKDPLTEEEIKNLAQKLAVSDDLEISLENAKKSGKPILLYFTGFAVVNSRKMEDFVLIDPFIIKFMVREMEMITLQVDDRNKLETFVQKEKPDGTTKTLRFRGQWNLNYQIEKFQTDRQPFFVILNSDEKVLATQNYTIDKVEFLNFLKTGKTLFEND